MTEAPVVELKPAFRGLCAKLRDARPLMASSVGHLGFEVSMMEATRAGVLQFVVLFADAAGNEVRMIWTAVGDDEVGLTIRGSHGARVLGAYRLVALDGTRLRDLLDGAVADAIARVEAFAVRRAVVAAAARHEGIFA